MILTVTLGLCLFAGGSHAFPFHSTSCNNPTWLMTDASTASVTKDNLYPATDARKRMSVSKAFPKMFENGAGLSLQSESQIGLTNLYNPVNYAPATITKIKVMGIPLNQLQSLQYKAGWYSGWTDVNTQSETGDTITFPNPISATAFKLKLDAPAQNFKMNVEGCL